MVTKRDNRQLTTDRQGEYRAICLGKDGMQSFAKTEGMLNILPKPGIMLQTNIYDVGDIL